MLAINLLPCGKKENAIEAKSEVYVKATIDGKPYFQDASDVSKVRVHYTKSSGSTGEFSLLSNSGDYESLNFVCYMKNIGKPETMDVFKAGRQKSRFEIYSSFSTQTNGKCVITSITNSVIEGTFYFEMYSDEGKGSTKIRVTDGQFKCRH